MRIKDLIEVLNHYPAESEIRVATCLEDPTYGNNHDLPLVGATTEFRPTTLRGVRTPRKENIVWLATSFYLEPQRAARSKTKRDD